MKAKLITISLLWALTHSIYAAQHVVYPGENIQDKVSIAATGDTVIISGGSYPDQSITMTKAIRLVREKGTTVTIGGLITLTDIPTEVVLRDFAININGNGKMVVKNCSRVGLEDLTLLPEGITIENSTMVIRSCQMGPVSVSTDSNIELINSNVSAVTCNSSDIIVANTDFTTGSFTGGSALIQQSNASGEVTFTGGSALIQQSNASGNVTFNTCNWRAHESTFKSNLKSVASDSKLIKSTVDLAFEHNGRQNDCTVFQSTVGRKNGSLLTTDANRSWISYSRLNLIDIVGGHYNSIINNKILGDTHPAHIRPTIYCHGQNLKLELFNNEIRSDAVAKPLSSITTTTGSTYQTSRSIIVGGILLASVKHYIRQDYSANLRDVHGRVKFIFTDGETAYSSESHSSESSWVTKTYNNPNPNKSVSQIDVETRQRNSTTAYQAEIQLVLSNGLTYNSMPVMPVLWVPNLKKGKIYNNFFNNGTVLISETPSESILINSNIFWNSTNSWSNHAISAPAQSGSSATHNYFQNASYAVTGGLSNFDNITGGDPGFVDSANGDFRLSSSSQLKDAGPEEPEFNDHDGSRNDIGIYGGHSYDPDGTTSTYPVIVGGDQSTYRINIGETNPIVIKARAAVSTSKVN